MGQGPPPLTGEAQGVLVLSAFGKRGGQAGGAAGHLCALDGSPALTRLSVPAASGTGLAQGRTTVCVSFLPPLSQAHPMWAYTPTFPGGQVQRVSRSVCRSCGSSHQDGGQVAGTGLSGSAGVATGPSPLLAAAAAAAAPTAGRPGAPFLLKLGLRQGREPGVREQSPRGALLRISRRHPFLGRIRPGPGRP